MYIIEVKFHQYLIKFLTVLSCGGLEAKLYTGFRLALVRGEKSIFIA